MALVEHRYDHAGLTLVGQLARPAGEPIAAILVLPEVNGLGQNVRRRAQMLADLGYIALAADPYGDGATPEGDAAFAAMNALRDDPDLLRARVAAGLSALAAVSGLALSRTAAIGYCFGGGCALELARSGAELAGVVSFHGLLSTKQPAMAGTIRARILVCHGAQDPLVPWHQVTAFHDEMTHAGADWQLIAYGTARHAFTNPNVKGGENPALAYDASADRQSWAAMQTFFGELFR